MKKLNLAQGMYVLITLLLPFVLIAIFWNQLPEQVPTHWNAKGEIDDYMPKFPGIFILPIINIVLFLFLLVLPKIDPKQNFQKFQKTYLFIILFMTSFFLILFLLTLMISLGYNLEMTQIVFFLVTIFMLILGNFMGKMRPNYFVGIRTPWTLENETVWAKTHRLGGFVWVAASFLMLVLLLFLPKAWIIYFFLVYVMLISLIPIIYSYILYTKIKKSED